MGVTLYTKDTLQKTLFTPDSVTSNVTYGNQDVNPPATSRMLNETGGLVLAETGDGILNENLG